METKDVINLIETFQKTPVTGHLIINGIDVEEKLLDLLKNEKTISQKTKLQIKNYFRNLVSSKMLDINKIPNVFR